MADVRPARPAELAALRRARADERSVPFYRRAGLGPASALLLHPVGR